MLESNVQWLAPAPLWATTASDLAAFHRPEILRFASDEFMNDLLALLDSNPADMSQLVAQYENWREPQGAPAPVEPVAPAARSLARIRRALAPPGADVTGASAPAGRTSRPLKLYQAA